MAYSDGYAGGYAGGLTADSQFQYMTVPWGQLETIIYGLDPGNDYEFSVAAYDHAGRSAGYSTPVIVSTAVDTSPPSTPAPPTLTQGVLEITVTHTLGLASGGTYNLESDLAELEVHISTSSGFTPNASTKVAALKADNSNLVTQRPVAVTVPVTDTATRYFKVVAVDRSGNASNPSGEVSEAPTLVTSSQIINRTIQSIDIDLEAITEELIAARAIFARHLYVADFDNLIFNPGAEAGLTLIPHAVHTSASGAGSWSVDTTNPRSGGNVFKYDTTGQTGKARLVLNVEDGDAASNPDSLISMSPGGWLASSLYNACESAAVANDAGIAFVWYDKDLVVVSETEQLNTNVAQVYAEVTLMAQAPATTAFAAIELRVADESNDNPIYFDDILVRRALEGNLIVDGTIEGSHLSSMTIEVGKYIQSTNYDPGVSGWRIPGNDAIPAEFNNVTVRGEVVATSGELQNLSITGALTLGTLGEIRTAATGQRVRISEQYTDRIQFFTDDTLENSPGTIRATHDAGGGAQFVFESPVDTGDTFANNRISFRSATLSDVGIELFSQRQNINILLVDTTKSIVLGEVAGPEWLNLSNTKATFDSSDATTGDTIFELDTDGSTMRVVRRGAARADLAIEGDYLSQYYRLPRDESIELDNLTTITASTWTTMTPTMVYTRPETKEVSVKAWGTVHADQPSGSAASVRNRIQISLNGGSTWHTSVARGRDQTATGDRTSLDAWDHHEGGMTGDIHVRMQVYSTSTSTDFLSGSILAMISGKLV